MGGEGDPRDLKTTPSAHSPGGCPDQEAKPAFPDTMASQAKEPDSGGCPVESWKPVLQWCRGKCLDWDLGDLDTSSNHHSPAT